MKRFFIHLIKAFVILNFLCCSLAQQNSEELRAIVTKRIILIGDAGEPAKEYDEPVLSVLKKYASEIKDSTIIIFLGDNVYPDGLPSDDHPDYEEYIRRLYVQVEAALKADAAAYFIPGNHDWGKGRHKSSEQLKRQADFVNQYSDKDIYFKPDYQCPGPDYIDFGNDLRIIFLDSQWWFNQNFIRTESSGCPDADEHEITDQLSKLIGDDEERFVIVASHHPLKTYGEHGGNFGFIDHIFPLLRIHTYLYIPLPVIGSVYPLLRNNGINIQDVSSSSYKNMINSIEPILNQRKGIIFASGHEHALQVIRGVNDNLYIVSGAGIYDKVNNYISEGNGTLYARAEPGFFILDFHSNGRLKLSAINVIDESGKDKIDFELTTK